MLAYKLFLILNEGLIFGILAIGIYVAFQWLRFPDLTPDGSFVLGASAYVKMVLIGFPPLLALVAAAIAGAGAGVCTAIITRFVSIPSVVSGLLVSSALYSVNWLILGKPNLFLEPKLTLVGDISGISGTVILLFWLIFFCVAIIIGLSIFSGSIWGLRSRAIGENPLLAHDLGTSESKYTVLGLALANGLVGFAGALFSQRSFSADINMGIGVTITGLAGIILGLLFTATRRKQYIILFGILIGSILHKTAIFMTLEIGIPAESFRLISSLVLVSIFFVVRKSNIEFLKGLRWN
jgi:putative ABC transport system permease protein